MARNTGHTFGHLQALHNSQPAIARPSNLITIVIPTIANSPTLHTAIRGWCWQTVPVRVLIIDTGSHRDEYNELEAHKLASPIVDLMRIAPRAWSHLSERVSAAIDAAIAIVETPLVVLTHDDVFLKRQSVLEELRHDHLQLGNVATGYEISPRSHITEQWRGMVSHTLTMLDVHACRRRNLRWSLQDAFLNPNLDARGQGWPDTETAFGLAIKDQLLDVTLIGHEPNDQHFEDDRICHRRSLTSHRFLWPELATKDEAWQQQTIARFEALYDGN